MATKVDRPGCAISAAAVVPRALGPRPASTTGTRIETGSQAARADASHAGSEEDCDCNTSFKGSGVEDRSDGLA